MSTILLAIDIGNTTVKFGIFKAHKLKEKFNIPTEKVKISKGIPQKYIDFLDSKQIDDIIICSVVPEVTLLIKDFFKKEFDMSSKVIGRDITVPIKNLYEQPQQVGQDRLVNAFAVSKLYTTPAIVVDFGTALTFDYINSKGDYEGGLIFPGVNVSLESLIKKASLLPSIDIIPTTNIIGKNTVESMNNGIIYGFSNITEGIIRQLKDDIGNKDVEVVGTGGDIEFFKKYMEEIKEYDNNLTLKGLCYLYQL